MRTNRAIKAEKVRLIGVDGEQIGVVSIKEALMKAEETGLDLVEIAPQAEPPVCRLINFGKFRYQQTKKEKESKKAQHQVKMKEIKLKPNTDIHDFETKAKHAREFLVKGMKVRVTCTFKGREMLHMELGDQIVERMIHTLEDIASPESPLKRMGKTITLVLVPAVKKAIKQVSETTKQVSDKES